MAQMLPAQLHEERKGIIHQCQDYKNVCTSSPLKHKDKFYNSLSSRRTTTRRTRTTFSPNQIAELEHNFLQASYLTPQRLAEVSAKLGLAKTQVKIWFKNRRRRKKLSMERDRLRDEPYPCSLSPTSIIDQLEGYPGRAGFPGSKADNGTFAPTTTATSLGIEIYSNSLNLYHYNNASAKSSEQYPTAAWYQADQHNQPVVQCEYKSPPPLPPGETIIKPILSTSMDFDVGSCLSMPTWDPQNPLVPVESPQSTVYSSPLSYKTDMNTGLSPAGDFQTEESTAKSQPILALYNDVGSDNMDFKKFSAGTTKPAPNTTGFARSFYNNNNNNNNNTRTTNEMPESNLFCTMDTIMRTYNHQTTSPSQFAYCFS